MLRLLGGAVRIAKQSAGLVSTIFISTTFTIELNTRLYNTKYCSQLCKLFAISAIGFLFFVYLHKHWG